MRRLARVVLGLAAWGALPVLARRGLASVGSWREVLDPMVAAGDRLVAVGSAALLVVWLAASGLVALGPLVQTGLRRARRGARAGTPRHPSRLWAARGWLVALLVGGSILATRSPAAAAQASLSADADLPRDIPRAADATPAPIGAISVLTCGLVASAVLTRLHRARLRVLTTTAASGATSGAVDPSVRETEVHLRRHAVPLPTDVAPSTSEQDPWSAVPIGLQGDDPITLDCVRGGTVVIDAVAPSLDVAAGVATALVGACGFACTVTVGVASLSAIPSLVPVAHDPDLADRPIVRVTRHSDRRVVDLRVVTSSDALGTAPIATLRESDGRWTYVERGVAIRPYLMSAADASGVARLEAAPYRRPARGPWVPPDDWQVLVRTMGPVSVELAGGEEVRFARPKSVELLAWLTHHRERPTRMAARTALWAVDVSDATVANVVSDARRSLARVVSAETEWIDRTYTDRLTFDQRIVSDVDLMAEALRASRASPSVESIARLDVALGFVRDLPFAGSDYLWPDEEGLTSHAVHLIASAARHSAEWHLERGDATAVVIATGHGLRALRGDEDLLALRTRAMRLARRGAVASR